MLLILAYLSRSSTLPSLAFESVQLVQLGILYCKRTEANSPVLVEAGLLFRLADAEDLRAPRLRHDIRVNFLVIDHGGGTA